MNYSENESLQQIQNTHLPNYVNLYDNFSPFVMLPADVTKNVSLTTEQLVLICFCTGRGVIKVNDKTINIEQHDYLVVMPHSKVQLIEFTPEMTFFKYSIHKKLVLDIFDDLSLNYDATKMAYDYYLAHLEEDDFQSRMRLYLDMKKEMMTADAKKSHTLARIYGNMIFVFDVAFFENSVRSNHETVSRQYIMFRKFVDLLNKHVTESREVQFYAHMLNITPKYLSWLCMSFSGKNASKWIEDYVVNIAKRMIREEQCNIRQIASHLNFPSQSFFGRYFKRVTGLSPREFSRSEML